MSKNDFNYLDVKLKVFKKDDNEEFSLVENLTLGEAKFNQFARLSNQLFIATENSGKEQKLSLVLIPTKSKDMDDKSKLPHKVVDVVDGPYRKIFATLLRYNVDKQESSYAQVRFFAWKKEVAKFQQKVYVIYKLEEFVHLLGKMNSVYDEVSANKPICIVL